MNEFQGQSVIFIFLSAGFNLHKNCFVISSGTHMSFPFSFDNIFLTTLYSIIYMVMRHVVRLGTSVRRGEGVGVESSVSLMGG